MGMQKRGARRLLATWLVVLGIATGLCFTVGCASSPQMRDSPASQEAQSAQESQASQPAQEIAEPVREFVNQNKDSNYVVSWSQWLARR